MKMKLKVEIVSREIIKPSSATPPNRSTFNLSLIDQHTPHVYIPFILFYSAINNHKDELNQTQRLEQMKTSLSETLTLYYPLAGRIKNHSIISCEDGGVQVLITQVIGCPLSQVLTLADPKDLVQFIPWNQRDEQALLILQINIFECGGIAIGVCISHKVADSSSLCAFLNTWASVSRGSSEIVPPKFDGSYYFPPGEVNMPIHIADATEKLSSTRYVFDAYMIGALQDKATSKNLRPSRVMAVVAFLWRIAMEVERKNKGRPNIRTSNVGIAVNLRSRMDPPVCSVSFGNFVAIAMASVTPSVERRFHESELVENLKEVVGRIDSHYVRKLQDGCEDEYSKLLESIGEVEEQFSKGDAERYAVSSWCRFPFYEVDFGWGKPDWAHVPSFHDKNFFVLMDTKCGEGIEAWVTLDEEDMARFRNEPELLAFFNSFSSEDKATSFTF